MDCFFRFTVYDSSTTLTQTSITPNHFQIGICNPTLSVSSNEEDENQLTIFPNPATEFIFLSGNASVADANAWVEISDLFGRIISTQKLKPNSRMNIAQLPAGIYFIRYNGAVGKFFKD